MFGVGAVLATLAVLVGWNIIFTRHYLTITASRTAENPGAGYWILLSIGDVALVFAVVTLIVFLVGNVQKVLALRRQTTFIDNISHELRSPLAGIKLSIETMTRHEVDEATRGVFLGRMLRDVERLERFIEHVIRASQIEHGDKRLEVRVVSLREQLDAAREYVLERHAARAPEIEIASSPNDADSDAVRADIEALRVVFQNVLDNACKYCEAAPSIRVEIAARAERVDVHFTDNGVGMSRAVLRRVFNRFERGDTNKTRQVKGSGLGLHVSRELLRQMGGDLVAHSDGDGRGSTFVVSLRRPRRTGKVA